MHIFLSEHNARGLAYFMKSSVQYFPVARTCVTFDRFESQLAVALR